MCTRTNHIVGASTASERRGEARLSVSRAPRQNQSPRKPTKTVCQKIGRLDEKRAMDHEAPIRVEKGNRVGVGYIRSWEHDGMDHGLYVVDERSSRRIDEAKTQERGVVLTRWRRGGTAREGFEE
jgi:hypothetical protein